MYIIPLTSERRALVEVAIERLPSAPQAAVRLCDIEGVSPHEAARYFGVPLNTLKSRLFRARHRLYARRDAVAN